MAHVAAPPSSRRTPPSRASSRARAGRRSPAAAAREGILTLAAAAGALCILAVVLAWVGGISLVMFRTGSMSPAIPTGSLAVVREIDATSVAVGDVVTVERPGALPVTHRVVEIAGQDPVTLTLKGDANPAPDTETYTVETVKEVLWSVPHVGYAVGRLQQPVALGATTFAVATLVTWVLWPRSEATRER